VPEASTAVTTYARVAASVAQEKLEHPERFCVVPRCLWRTQTVSGENPCRKHPRPPTLEDKLVKSIELTADERWKTVTATTVVIWEGVPTTWGELAGNEKMQCEWNDNGVLEGGSPF
jgi:hypothetical protein